MSSKLSAQLPLLIVHLTTVGTLPSPAVTPVIVVVGLLAFVIAPGPLWMLHNPVPTTAVLPAITNVALPHWSISTPASATVGAALLVSTTSSKLGVHTAPLDIVHLKVTLLPAVKPVTFALKLFSSPAVITAPFAAPWMLHVPVPLAGLLPASVKAPLLHCS